MPSNRKKIRNRMRGQNDRRTYVCKAPLMVTRSSRQFAVAEKLEPVSLRHVVQWQRPDWYGSSRTSYLTDPQRQPPVGQSRATSALSRRAVAAPSRLSDFPVVDPD